MRGRGRKEDEKNRKEGGKGGLVGILLSWD